MWFWVGVDDDEAKEFREVESAGRDEEDTLLVVEKGRAIRRLIACRLEGADTLPIGNGATVLPWAIFGVLLAPTKFCEALTGAPDAADVLDPDDAFPLDERCTLGVCNPDCFDDGAVLSPPELSSAAKRLEGDFFSAD